MNDFFSPWLILSYRGESIYYSISAHGSEISYTREGGDVREGCVPYFLPGNEILK